MLGQGAPLHQDTCRSSSSLYCTLQCVHSLQSPGSPSKWQAWGHPNRAPGHSGDNVHRMCTCTGVIAIAVPSVHSPTHRGLQLPPFYRCRNRAQSDRKNYPEETQSGPLLFPEFAEVSYLGRGLLSCQTAEKSCWPWESAQKACSGFGPPRTWFLGERSKSQEGSALGHPSMGTWV